MRPLPRRPLTLTEVLDGAFALVRSAPALFLTVTAVFVVPMQLLVAYLNRDLLDEGLVDVFGAAVEGRSADTSSDAAALITFFWGSLQLPFIAIAFSRIVDGWYAGREPTAREALGHAVRHAPAALAAWVLVHLIEAAGLVTLGLFTLVAMTWFAVTAPAIGFEGVGPLAAMGRAFRLSSKAFWFTMGAAVLVGVVEGFLGLGFAALPSAAATLLGSSWGWLLIAAGSMIGSLVTVTFVAGSSVVLYLALRIRVEGLDLEVRSRELAGSEQPR
jgi:hypothetical protein